MNLVCEQGGLAGQVFPLNRPVIYIGRAQDTDLVLPEEGASRRHASIQRAAQGWLLTDLGSTNGTYVDGQRIGQPHLLRPGERVSIGSSVFLVQQAGAQAGHPGERRGLSRPVLIVGAICLGVVLVGLVLLLVTFLQPAEPPLQPTPQTQMGDFMTALPIPTQMQNMMTSIVPVFSSVLPGFPSASTATPEPDSSLPGSPLVGRPAGTSPPPAAQSSSREVGP
jgi:pSer/pThr/pTyr-binding forkhead associated (FHA) protein